MNFNEIKHLLNLMPSPIDKLEMVMDLGKSLENVPDSAVCNEIVGCSSFVEICRDGNRFYGRADAAIVRGIVAIIISVALCEFIGRGVELATVNKKKKVFNYRRA